MWGREGRQQHSFSIGLGIFQSGSAESQVNTRTHHDAPASPFAYALDRSTGKDPGTTTLERRLWEAADQLRANSGLTSQQYSQPVLGLIFLRFAEARFLTLRKKLEAQAKGSRRGSRVDDPKQYHAEGVLYLAPED